MSIDPTPKLHFHRYEFKYFVSGDKLAAVLRELELRLQRDMHSDLAGSYFVRSHYFDTDDFAVYHEKVAGLRERYKFRLRNYSSGPNFSDPLFLELKGKVDNLVHKHRMVLDPQKTEIALSTDTTALAELILESGKMNGTGSRFVFDVFRKRISPSVIVDYQRTAFENSADPDFRATLDREILSIRAGHDGHPRGPALPITGDLQILEIKFRYRLPRWFHRLIQELQLERVSISKFAVATEQVYLKTRCSSLNRILERRAACLN
jgi:hypothetical protein